MARVSDEDIAECVRIRNKYAKKFTSPERRASDRRDTIKLLGVIDLLLREVLDARNKVAKSESN